MNSYSTAGSRWRTTTTATTLYKWILKKRSVIIFQITGKRKLNVGKWHNTYSCQTSCQTSFHPKVDLARLQVRALLIPTRSWIENWWNNNILLFLLKLIHFRIYLRELRRERQQISTRFSFWMISFCYVDWDIFFFQHFSVDCETNDDFPSNFKCLL